MRLAKWGNCLGVRIPADVVEKLNLKPGEEMQLTVTGENQFEICRDRRRQDALEAIRKLRIAVPTDYVFNRDELYDQ